MPQKPGLLGQQPFFASAWTPGSRGHNDAADPDSPEWFLGDTPGSLGKGDFADPTRRRGLACGPDFCVSGGDVPETYRGLLLPPDLIAPVSQKGKEFELTMIPEIMRSRKLFCGADLLDDWFSRFPNEDPRFGKPNTTTITMDWVLGFARAKKVHDQILSDKLFANSPAQFEIAKMLNRNGKIGNKKEVAFGDFSRPIPEIDKDYVQERAVDDSWTTLPRDAWGQITDDFDDLTASLHAFNFRVAVKGTIELKKGPSGQLAHFVSIEEVGIYVQDSFNFNEEQYLGRWDGFNIVANSDFRKWRKENGMGGDFMVFSDVEITELDMPVTFQMPAQYEMLPVSGDGIP